VLCVFMDESGIHDVSPVVTVGSYVATPKQWKLWTKDWNDAKGAIKVFHASDCEALVEEFKGWETERRNKFVANLLPVLPRFKLRGLVVGINLDDYNAAMKGRDDLRKLLGSPYTACFHWTVAEILSEAPSNRRIAFFHETNSYRGEALEAFAALQKSHKARDRTSLTFGSKAEYVPLQAADIIAFEGNKRLRGPLGRKPRKAWTALDNANGEARVRIKYLNRENIDWVIQRLEDVRAYNAGLITEVPQILAELPSLARPS